MITVKLKKIDGSEVSLENIDPNALIANSLRARCAGPELDVHPSLQRLIFGGAELTDGRTLTSYRVGNDSVVHLVVRQQPVHPPPPAAGPQPAAGGTAYAPGYAPVAATGGGEWAVADMLPLARACPTSQALPLLYNSHIAWPHT